MHFHVFRALILSMLMFQFWNPKTALGLSVILVRSYTSWPIFLQHFSPCKTDLKIFTAERCTIGKLQPAQQERRIDQVDHMEQDALEE